MSQASYFNPDVEVPLFVVMPNHVHFVVYISGHRNEGEIIKGNPVDMRSPNSEYKVVGDEMRAVPVLSRYVNQFKGAVKRYANRQGADFKWQPLYFDRAIRNREEANNIDEYIKNNVAKWAFDKYCD